MPIGVREHDRNAAQNAGGTDSGSELEEFEVAPKKKKFNLFRTLMINASFNRTMTWMLLPLLLQPRLTTMNIQIELGESRREVSASCVVCFLRKECKECVVFREKE